MLLSSYICYDSNIANNSNTKGENEEESKIKRSIKGMECKFLCLFAVSKGGNIMSRPTTKLDLINTANEQFEKMWKLIDAMTDDERNATFNFGDDFNKK